MLQDQLEQGEYYDHNDQKIKKKKGLQGQLVFLLDCKEWAGFHQPKGSWGDDPVVFAVPVPT